MAKIKNIEKLSLLGFSDPCHSLLWYREKYKNLPSILEQFIVDTVNNYGVFPKEANIKDKNELYHKYYLIIERKSNKYFLKINDTDRRKVVEEYVFNDVNEAAKFLINKSYTVSGSVTQYWNQ